MHTPTIHYPLSTTHYPLNKDIISIFTEKMNINLIVKSVRPKSNSALRPLTNLVMCSNQLNKHPKLPKEKEEV